MSTIKLTPLQIIEPKITNFLEKHPENIRTIANVFSFACTLIQITSVYKMVIFEYFNIMQDAFKKSTTNKTTNIMTEFLFTELEKAMEVLTEITNSEHLKEVKKYFQSLGLEDSLEGYLRKEYKLGDKYYVEELLFENVSNLMNAARSKEHFKLPGKYHITPMMQKINQYYEDRKMSVMFPTTKFSGPLSYHYNDSNGLEVGEASVTYFKNVIFFTITE